MQIGMSITKSVLFRGVQQEFANVYHYYLTGAATGPWSDLIDENVVTEKLLHTADVTFKRAAVWSSGGTIAQNQMLFQKALSGLGSKQVDVNFDRERAVLIQWPAGVDSRGKPVYLRKWYHSGGAIDGVAAFSSAVKQNTAEIPSADRVSIAAAVDAVTQIGIVEAWNLCAESGRVPTGPPVCHRFLEHHQLGDMWR